MAEYLRMHYSLIMLAAAIPALLYYISEYAYVHIEAKKLGMTRVTREQITPLTVVMRRQGYMIVPIVVIIYLLLKGRTPLYAAFYGIVSSVAVTAAAGIVKGTFAATMKSYLRALEQGARQAVSVGVACAVVGIINSITNLTSLGFVLGNSIVSLAEGSIIFTALLTTLVSIILGMGLPTVAAYIIGAVMFVPALGKLGVAKLAAHFFVMYYSVLCMVTPPVALAAFAAAAIAKGNPYKTGWIGFGLGLAIFVMPFAFVNDQALLWQGEPMQILLACFGILCGTSAWAIALQGWLGGFLRLPVRLLFAVLCFIIVWEPTLSPGWNICVVTFIVLSAACFRQWGRSILCRDITPLPSFSAGQGS
jgi:TRAP transporter 4TM/12TM fusion protein